MIRLYGLLALIELVLLVIALIDCLSTDKDAVRHLPKIIWVLLILLFSPVGAIVWFVVGRPETHTARPGAGWQPGTGFPERDRPRRPLGPDDDPEFLRNAGRDNRNRDDHDLFTQWETDLRRREEELRRKGETPEQ